MGFKTYITETKSIIDIYEHENIGTLNEGGLSRVLSKVNDQNLDFLFITASRGSNTPKQNRSLNNKLIKDIRSKYGKEIGAYKVVGHWKECSQELKDGQTIKDCEGTIENALEETWLITKPDNMTSEQFDKMAQDIAKKYNQDAYVIRSKGKLELRGKDGETWANLGKASNDSLSSGFEKIANVQGYSELADLRKKGRSANIIFENLYVVEPKDNNRSKQLFQEAGISYIKE